MATERCPRVHRPRRALPEDQLGTSGQLAHPRRRRSVEIKIQKREEHQEDRNPDQHPAEEGDLHSDQRPNEANADHVRRRADRCGQATDRGRERRHQHQRRGVAGIDAGGTAGRSKRGKNRESDPEHHRGGRGVGDPPGDECRHRTERQQNPARSRADPGEGEHSIRDPAVEPVEEDRARQNERADEQEHQRVGEWSEHLLGRGDLKRHAGRGAEQCGHREWQRLGDPQDHHRRQHCRQTMRRGREGRHWKCQQQEEHCGGEDGSDFLAHQVGDDTARRWATLRHQGGPGLTNGANAG